MNLRLGKLAPKFPGALRTLDFYVAGPLPAAPASVAPPAFADWAVLGNDRYGDCGVAGLQHLFEADATITDETEAWPSDQQVIDYYLAYTDGQDTGVVLSEFLEFVRANGFIDAHTVAAYAPVDHDDVTLLQQSVWLFGAAYCGISVTQGMMEQFQAGQPWTVPSAADPVIGGHCVPCVGYDDSTLTVVTWGQEQRMTYSAWHRLGDEAWAVLTGEFVAAHGDGRGINLVALQDDLHRL